MRRSEKGQVFSYDLLIAMAVFMILFFLLTVMFESNIEQMQESEEFKEMKLLAASAANNLILTPGRPSNWQKLSVVEDIGLVKYKRVILNSKLTAFNNINYDKAKNLMNLRDYEFYASIEQNNIKVFEKGSLVSTAEQAAIYRVVEYNGKPARFYFVLYK